MLARRQEPARLLIIGTYRPVEVLTRDHPLKGIKQELQLHGQCEELALDFLSEAACRGVSGGEICYSSPSPCTRSREGRGNPEPQDRTKAGPSRSPTHGWQSIVHGERDQ